MTVIRIVTGAICLALALAMPVQKNQGAGRADRRAIFGGAAGAIIGGAAGGCGGAAAGAIIGAATGAAPGAQMERRRTGFYWYKGRCWQRDPGATIIGCRAAIAVDPAKPRLTKAAQLQPQHYHRLRADRPELPSRGPVLTFVSRRAVCVCWHQGQRHTYEPI